MIGGCGAPPATVVPSGNPFEDNLITTQQAPERLAAALADRYRIERELGQGGMATVYLAQDFRHNRRVAVKVLRPELAAVIGADRFLSEITTTANLQHPHILPLFDSGAADSFLFYVMPYVEGESLRNRLDREKQLPISDAVRIATEVASALDYAHRHGVIHRDIKPENILLHDGQALVADFGIALAASKAGSRMTETGMSLGTPHYMSPEQAMGEREITARSDVYALGAMTYEMLSGDPPFTGSTAQAIVAKVLTSEPPPLRPQRRSIPEHVEAAVMTALEKLPADRFATAGEFASAVTGATRAPTGSTRLVSSTRRTGWPVIAAVGVAALALGILAGMGFRRAPVAEAQPARFEITAPGRGFTPFRSMSLSPDGRLLVYFVAGAHSERSGLYRRPLDQLEPEQIGGASGIEAAGNPSIAPDGREMLLSRSGQMYRASVAGGQATPLPDVPESPFNGINEAGDVIYTGTDGGIWRLPRGGAPARVSVPDTANGERVQFLSDLLPGGRLALVGAGGGTGFTRRLYVLDLETGSRRPLLETEVRGAWYAGRNTLLYVTNDQMLHGIRFDPEALETSGEPVSLGGPVETGPLGTPRLTVSRTGTVVYAPRNAAELVEVNLQGIARPLLDRRAEFHNPRFSPDGRSVSMDIIDPTGRDVWVLSLEQGTLTRATFDNDGHDAIWARDGRSLVYVATREGRIVLLRSRLDGGTPEQLAPDAAAAPSGWTADGRLLAITAGEAGRQGWNIMADSGGRLRPFIVTNFSEAWASTSPDGRWVAYASDASRRFEVYVRPVDGGQMVQVSVDGALEPVWSADGRTLYYSRTAARELVAARLELGPVPRVVSRETLFSLGDLEGAEPHPNYDVAADGRMVMVRRSQMPRFVLIQNVDRLVETGKPR